MSTDDLTQISGLEDKHARALGRRPLQITTFRELASADGDAIYRAMHRFQPRPERKDIARWQAQARRKLTVPAINSSEWQRVASFAVVFWRRQVGGDWEKKLEVEQTEVEPPKPPFVESSWDCRPGSDWMLEHLGQAHIGGEHVPGTPASGEEQVGSSEKADGTARRHAARERLHIESAAVIDATGQVDLVQAGEMTASPSTELVSPDRLILTVTGAQPGHEVCAVAGIRAHGEEEWHYSDPVTTDRSGRAELSLALSNVGETDITLLAWTPDATAYLVSVPLPPVTIRPVANASR